MATYPKKLKSIEIYLLPDGKVLPVLSDTAADDIATRLLNAFKNYETMTAYVEDEGQGGYASIPYHAVQYIKVTETEADIEKADAYGCE